MNSAASIFAHVREVCGVDTHARYRRVESRYLRTVEKIRESVLTHCIEKWSVDSCARYLKYILLEAWLL